MFTLKIIFRTSVEAIGLGSKVFSKVSSGTPSVEIVLELEMERWSG